MEKAYAGAICPKCHKGINNEKHNSSEIAQRVSRRFGGRLCNKCIESYGDA